MVLEVRLPVGRRTDREGPLGTEMLTCDRLSCRALTILVLF